MIKQARLFLLPILVLTTYASATYGNWFPYDGFFQRRAEVRDTWNLHHGSWI